MAPLEVIGASFGRTGTDSLRLALNKLGYETHHMRDVFAKEDSDHAQLFIDAYDDPENADFDRIYEGYNAAVDWPTATFIEPLLKKYPNAKFIYIDRDFESWYKSASTTIFTNRNKVKMDNMMPNTAKMLKHVIHDGNLQGASRSDDKEKLYEIYHENFKWCKQNIPQDQILFMKLGEGWDRLCQFLQKPVPNEEYPRTNSAEDRMKSRENQLQQNGTTKDLYSLLGS